MSDELIQAVIETADEAKRHRIELQELLDELVEAKTQIKESATDAHQKLCNHFTSLKVCIVNALDQRLTELRQDVTGVEKCALEPLESCEALIRKEAQKADAILAEGKQLLSGDVDSPESAKLMADFKVRISALDLNSLPEVPSLQEVACIHVDLPKDSTDIESQLIEAIQEYGQVIGRAPVQIVETLPRPGALLIKWAETQIEDPDSDINEFNVRCCRGDLRRDTTLRGFTDVYLGHSQQVIVRRLTDGVPYSFQVRGRPQGEDTWSPWSVPCVAMTTIGAYKWKQGAAGYDLDSTCTSVTRTNSLASTDCQFSNDAVFECGQSINF